MTNALTRAQAVYRYVATSGAHGRTFEEIADHFDQRGLTSSQTFDALAKLTRDDVIASRGVVETPRRYRALPGRAANHPDYGDVQ